MDIQPSRMIALGSWAFFGFGALTVLIGVAILPSDPGGLAAIAFGAVFIGAGWLMRRLFATPDGMKAVTVQSGRSRVSRLDGRPATRSEATVIHVPEDADEAEARRKWLAGRMADRPDWAAGRVEPEHKRTGTRTAWMAGIWGALTALGLLAGAFWDWIGYLVAGGAALTAAPAIYRLVHARLHRGKFAESTFVTDHLPARLGGTLAGTVETGIGTGIGPGMRTGGPPRDWSSVTFSLKLSCIHTWEEARSTGSRRSTYIHTDAVWSAESETIGRTGRDGRIDVPVEIALPTGQRETTLGGGRTGITWQLAVSAPLPGLDYRVAFTLPVLAPQGTG